MTVLPYNSITIDSSYRHIYKAITFCLTSKRSDTPLLVTQLQQLWLTKANTNYTLPCLSVRSGLDLFLQASSYSQGSEVLMTAINIKDMAQVIQHQGLKVIPVDIYIDSLEPKMNLMEILITSRTVAILVAHLYGCWINMEPIIALAERCSLDVIEDCAECFCGFSRLSHPRSNISLFSFGVIKFSTSFGGAIAKVRNEAVYNKMKILQSQYPLQSNHIYLKKVLKYTMLYIILYMWPFPHLIQKLINCGYDPKDVFVNLLRGFPSNLLKNIRHQPSSALLATMLHTHCSFDRKSFDLSRVKGEYFLSRLTSHMYPVGMSVTTNNFWLFPVLVKNPAATVKLLNQMGLAAYRGSTQLSVISGDGPPISSSSDEKGSGPTTSHIPNKTHHPQEVEYLIDHVIYLPINKRVPIPALNQMLMICEKAMNQLHEASDVMVQYWKSKL